MMLAMAPPDPRCTIRNKIENKAVLVPSLAECSGRYGANKTTIILIGTVFEVEIGPKVTTSGRRRTFVVAKFDLGGGDMKYATINIRSVKLHTPEPLRPATDGDGGERAAAATTTTTENTTITDPVLIRVLEAPAPDPLNNEAFRVVVAQTMAKTPGWSIYKLTEAGGSVVGDVLAHVMDASTVEMPPPPPLPRVIPVTLPPLTLPTIPAPHTPSPHRCYPGVRPMTRSHSTGEKEYCHGRKWFEDDYSVKHNIKGPHPFLQWFLRTTIGSQLTPGCEEGNNFPCLDYFLLLLSPNQIIQITMYTSQQLVKHGEKGAPKGGIIKQFGIIILAARFEFGYMFQIWRHGQPVVYCLSIKVQVCS